MRSRFEAFRDADAEWLLACWHPSTRPSGLDLTSNPTWRGLQIVDVVDGSAHDSTGVVEFRATYLAGPGEVRVLHERSRFVRDGFPGDIPGDVPGVVGGRWYYLDGDAGTSGVATP